MINQATKWMRRFVPVLLGLGLVVGGLELGSGPAPAQAATPKRYWAPGELPEFPGGLEYPLGDGLAVNGIPLRISYFEAPADAASVRDFYVDALERRDLVTRTRLGVENGWTVSALSEDGLSEIVVAIMGRGHNRSLVFPSIIPLGVRADDQDVSKETVLTPTSIGLLRVSAADRPGESVYTYQEPNEPAYNAAIRIRDELGRRGWSLARFSPPEPGSSTKSWILEVQRDGRRVRHTLTDWSGASPGSAITVELSGVKEGENHATP